MKTFQQIVIDRIESTAAQYGIDCSLSSYCSNVGSINLHEPGNVQPFGGIRYDFQHGDWKASIKIGNRFIPSQQGRADYFDFYQNNDAPTLFWKTLERELALRYRKQAA